MTPNDLFRRQFSVFRSGAKVTSEIQTSDIPFNVGFKLSQPMGMTEFFSTAKK